MTLTRGSGPLDDIDETLLERTQHTSHCPFKGDASYWSLRRRRRARTPSGPCGAIWWHVHAGHETLRDAAHSYELPRVEAMKVRRPRVLLRASA